MIDLARLKYGYMSQPDPPAPHEESAIAVETLVLVEGKDDVWFFDRLFSDVAINPSTHKIVEVGGKGKFGRYLTGLLQRPPITLGLVKRIAIIGDADEDKAKTEKALSDQLKKLNLPMPSDGGWMGKDPKIGRLLLSDADYYCVDSFCKHIADTDPAMIAVTNLLATHQVDSNNKWKRHCAAFLAARRPGKNFLTGTGIGFFDDLFGTGHPTVGKLGQRIKKFLA